MRTRIKYLFIYILLALLFIPSFLSHASARIAFVGNSVVDLAWDYSCCSFEYYRVLRDGKEIARITNHEITFYRDNTVSKGEQHSYQVCQVYYPNSTSEGCSSELTATVGEVKGRIYQDLTLETSPYDIYGDIFIEDGATLSIASEINLKGIYSTDYEDWTIYGRNGQVQFNGATLDGIQFNLEYGNNWLKNCSVIGQTVSNYVSGYKSAIIAARDDSQLEISNSQFSYTDIRYQFEASGLIDHNIINDSYLSMDTDNPDVALTIRNNEITNSHLFLHGTTPFLVNNNYFIYEPDNGSNSAISIHDAPSTTIRKNNFSMTSNNNAIHLDKISHAKIEYNTIENCASGIAIGTAGDVANEPAGETTITGNGIYECQYGAEFFAGNTVLYQNNFQSNVTGVYANFWLADTASSLLRQNCIAGNTDYGVEGYGEYQALDAANNWWGDISGPMVVTNSGGQGDAIYLTSNRSSNVTVSYEPWLSKSNCSTNSPPPVNISAPTIKMTPSKNYLFQANIMESKGFIITIHDDDGVWDDDQKNWKINLGTFRVFLNGNNVTDEFLDTINDHKLLTYTREEKEVKFLIKPDPKKFLSEHNLFNIKENGAHYIYFRICDSGGKCGDVTYEIYFGPFALLLEPVAVQKGLNTNSVEMFTLKTMLGNLGYATDIEVYFVIGNSGETWSLALSEKIPWIQGIHAYKTYKAPLLYNSGSFDWPIYGFGLPLDRVGSTATFYLGFKDKQTGEYTIDFEKIIVK